MTTIACGTVHRLDVPPEIVNYITDRGGKNLHGDPLYRIVWSNNATKETRAPWPTIPGAAIVERPHRLRYGKAVISDRFVIESWRPPEFYGDPRDWKESGYSKSGTYVDYGPYPSRGVYSMVDIVEDSLSNFTFPTRGYIDAVLLASNIRASMTPEQERDMVERAEEAEERATYERRLAMIQDANKPSNYHDIWMSMNIQGKKD